VDSLEWACVFDATTSHRPDLWVAQCRTEAKFRFCYMDQGYLLLSFLIKLQCRFQEPLHLLTSQSFRISFLLPCWLSSLFFFFLASNSPSFPPVLRPLKSLRRLIPDPGNKKGSLSIRLVPSLYAAMRLSVCRPPSQFPDVFLRQKSSNSLLLSCRAPAFFSLPSTLGKRVFHLSHRRQISPVPLNEVRRLSFS